MTFKKIISLLGLSILIWSIMFITAQKGFYEYTGADIDLVRLPLLKPYEIASGSRSGNPPWQIMETLPKMNLDKDVKYIRADSIGIHNNIFIIFSGNMWVNNISTKGWVVFDVSKEKGRCFLTYPEYLVYIKDEYDIDYIHLYLPENIFKNYKKDYTLPPEWNEHIEKEKKERWWDLW